MIKFSCSKCGRSYRVSDEYGGKRVRCKGCSQVNTIPQPESENLGNGDSIAAYNNLLKELSKAEKTAPRSERNTGIEQAEVKSFAPAPEPAQREEAHRPGQEERQ